MLDHSSSRPAVRCNGDDDSNGDGDGHGMVMVMAIVMVMVIVIVMMKANHLPIGFIDNESSYRRQKYGWHFGKERDIRI